MSSFSVAIATSEGALPPGETLLIEALAEIGVNAAPAVWSSAEVDWSKFSAVVIRTCWDYHLRVEEFLAWIESLEEKDVLVVNYPGLIRWNIEKTYLTEFEAQGVTIPETVWLKAGESADVADLCAVRGWREAVVKPIVSASAYGTKRRSSGVVCGPMMVQRYLSAIESEGEWSLIYFADQFSHAVRKRPQAADFRVQKEHGGSVEAATPGPDLLLFAASALRALPLPATFARVDLVEQQGKIYLMEMEVIEPELFLNSAEGSARRLAKSIVKELSPKGH